MSQTILIVDDAPDWRYMLAGLLNDVYSDVDVRLAGSMDEAKKILAEHACVLAIIDIRLDDSREDNVDGLYLAEHVKKHHPNTKSLIITGYANLDTVARALRPNSEGIRLADDYIQKDRLQQEFLARVAAILEN